MTDYLDLEDLLEIARESVGKDVVASSTTANLQTVTLNDVFA